MRHYQTSYILDRIKEPGQALTDALKIYSGEISPGIRTATNDIVFWTSKYNDSFQDELFVFSLKLNGKIVGFAQLVFFSEEQTLVVDYMVIDREYRRHSTFFQFVDQIRTYLHSNNIHYNLAVTEVAHFTNTDQPSEDSKKLIRLLKMAGFGVLKARYYQPPLGLSNPESLMRATLMILREDARTSIRRDTFLALVNTIYYKHYFRWYQPLPGSDCVKYRTQLDKLFSQVQATVSTTLVTINGSWDMSSDNHVHEPSKNTVVISASIYVVMVLCVFLLLSWIGFALKLGDKTLVIRVFLSLVIVMAILSVFSKQAHRVFNKLVTTLAGLSRSSK